MTQKQLKKKYYYDPHSGIFFNRTTGQPLGFFDSRPKDCYIHVCGKPAHRLAFLYMTGKIPKEVDHVNGVRTDNRWENLREVTRRDNTRNAHMLKTNTSGACGVSWSTDKNKWRAQIAINHKNIHLGYFDNIQEAVCARKEAEKKYGGFSKRHGKEKRYSPSKLLAFHEKMLNSRRVKKISKKLIRKSTKKVKKITVKRLQKTYNYDPVSGTIEKKKATRFEKTPTKRQILFALLKDRFPDRNEILLFKNGNKNDYAFDNLIFTSSDKMNLQLSMKNHVPTETNPYPGVSFMKSKGKWRARIGKAGKNQKYLGLFDTKEAAITARKKAEQ